MHLAEFPFFAGFGFRPLCIRLRRYIPRDLSQFLEVKGNYAASRGALDHGPCIPFLFPYRREYELHGQGALSTVFTAVALYPDEPDRTCIPHGSKGLHKWMVKVSWLLPRSDLSDFYKSSLIAEVEGFLAGSVGQRCKSSRETLLNAVEVQDDGHSDKGGSSLTSLLGV